MVSRMNSSSYDEYEEVESPFAPKSPDRSSSQRLRSRKNVFNRPFAAEPSIAPAVFETTGVRRSIGQAEQTEFLDRRQGRVHEAAIDYLDEEVEEEEEVVETRPARVSRPSAKKKSKAKKNLLSKIGWSVIGLLVLRLIFMDRGVWDYFSTEGTIREKQEELRSLEVENQQITAEISRINVDRNYQRQLAKEHLGVIAADEFLILFAGESTESATQDSRQL